MKPYDKLRSTKEENINSSIQDTLNVMKSTFQCSKVCRIKCHERNFLVGISLIVLTDANRQPGKPTKEATSDEEEEDEETAQEKKLRLTKEYLAQLAEEGKN